MALPAAAWLSSGGNPARARPGPGTQPTNQGQARFSADPAVFGPQNTSCWAKHTVTAGPADPHEDCRANLGTCTAVWRQSKSSKSSDQASPGPLYSLHPRGRHREAEGSARPYLCSPATQNTHTMEEQRGPLEPGHSASPWRTLAEQGPRESKLPLGRRWTGKQAQSFSHAQLAETGRRTQTKHILSFLSNTS